MIMSKNTSKNNNKTPKRPHPMPRKAGVGTGRGYKCGGRLKK